MTITHLAIVGIVAFLGLMAVLDALERRETREIIRRRANEEPCLDMVIREATRAGQLLNERERAQ